MNLNKAYNKEQLEKECLKAIKENEIVFFSEICAYVKPSNATLYNYKLEKLDSIKDALKINRINIKAALRKSWEHSASATERIALYKLISSIEEHEKISGQHLDHTTKGDKIESIKLIFSEEDKNESD